MVTGPLVAHFELVPPIVGFVLFAIGGIVSVITGLVSLVQLVRGRGLTMGGGIGVVAAVVFLVIASRGAGVPRINDFTTDPSDPPAFTAAATLPQNAGRDLSYPQAFAAIQRECCADLHPANLRVPPAEAHARALAVARGMPMWTVTRADPGAQTIEAVATSQLFRFQDDIVIRVRPEPDGSRVDMRSKSRVGQGDIGANTTRIRAFIAALEAAR